LQRIACFALVRLTLLAVSSVVVPSPAVAQSADLHGVVYADVNANGQRDASERGVSGVMVSNQRDVVVSDSLGQFVIASGTTGIVFVSVPDGFRSSGAFWRTTRAAPASVDFGLARRAESRTFSFVHASDSHIAPENVDRFRRFRQMTDSLNPAFALMGGDLIRDAMSQTEAKSQSYFDLFTAESKAFRTPLWMVPGNHDHYGIIRSRSHADSANPLYNRGMYRQYFGPDYYSFTYGGVHFIGLNTIVPDDSAYYGAVDSVQMEWLKRDLGHVPAAMPIVTFNHIPMISSVVVFGYDEDPLVATLANVNGKKQYRHVVGNMFEVLEAMRGHEYALALGSHMHSPERLSFVSDGVQLRSEVSAAIVGGNEVGPLILPSGFTLYTVRDGKIDAGQFFRLDPPRPRP
jgi:Calcineurin-like phosphoesterase